MREIAFPMQYIIWNALKKQFAAFYDESILLNDRHIFLKGKIIVLLNAA
jgi:hypothetical protein